MTQVKTLHYATSQDGALEHVKVTYLDGNVVLLNADEPRGEAEVLVDNANGDFDYFHMEGLLFSSFDTPEQVAEWDEAHPDAKLVFGEAA